MMMSAQKGDTAAYSRLLVELGHVIERYLLARFGNVISVEDCVQEILLAIHRARHTWEPGRAFRPWLFTIAKHKAIDELRRERSRQVPREAVDGQSVNAEVEEAATVSRLLRRLDRDKSEALILTKVVGLTCVEAAEHCGISEPAMKLRVHRGIKQARRLLEEDESDD